MKTSYIYLLIIALLGVTTGCHKEEIEEPLPEQQPVFTAQGTIGSETFSVKAGEENFYMHTFMDEVNGVKLFSGKLSNGDFELEMGIYDGNIDLPATNNENIPETIQFASLPTEPLAVLSKELLPNHLLIQEIKWYIDGVYSGLNEALILQPGRYDVCAEVTFTDGSSDTLCNEMILGYEKHATCKVRHFLAQNGSLQTWVEEDQVPVQSIDWYVDGVFQSSALKLFATIDIESHLVTAEITFVNGVKRTKSILIDGSLSGKFIDDFSVFEVGTYSFNWDFNATISMKKDGKHYVSMTAQNQSSEVQLIDISYFGKNSAGKTVFKVTAEVSCNLKEETTGEIVPFVCSTVFALEIN